MYRIVEEPIAADALHEAVRSDSDGAVVTFSGVVRNNSGGSRTLYLVYDAYRGMAEKKMEEIGGEAKARWEVDQVAVLHRVGRLEIGEISVLIAVSSPHRQAAFEACRYTIDQLKAVAPIWKKEVWVDGEAWIGGDLPAEEQTKREG